MQAEIITIGDEILIGQIVDTNSAWLGTQLSQLGISVKQITSVSDEKQHILSSLKDAENRADIIIITGGLGPTKDDITKHTLCEYFGSKLVMNEEVLAHVRGFFEKRNRPMLDVNIRQAEVPVNCDVLFNELGTAPGMWFVHNQKIFISMPGVPYEMKGIFTQHVIPKLKENFVLPHIYHRTLLTQGIGESFLAQKIKDIEDSLEKDNIRLAYLPSPGKVKLRLSARGEDKEGLHESVNAYAEKFYQALPEYIYGEEELGNEPPTFQNLIGSILTERKKTMSVAESCTGGYISHLITSVPGSSAYFIGSVIAYDYDVKTSELDVRQETLKNFGAVSLPCAEEMAKGILQKYKTHYAVSTTGIAGPGGATPTKPVGTVCIAVATKDRVISKQYSFGNYRDRNIVMASEMALSMLYKLLKEEHEQ